MNKTNFTEIWDEEKLNKLKKILFDKWQKICFSLGINTNTVGEINWKNWLNENEIKSYKELWVCVQFLDTEHVLVDINPKSSFQEKQYKLFLLVPKDFAKKLLLLSTFENE